MSSSESNITVEIGGHGPSMCGLKKPEVPDAVDQNTKTINEMIVDKSWKLMIGSKLHEVYTQKEMEDFINSACRNDFDLLQKKFKISSIDTAIDLVMVPIKYRLLTHKRYQ